MTPTPNQQYTIRCPRGCGTVRVLSVVADTRGPLITCRVVQGMFAFRNWLRQKGEIVVLRESDFRYGPVLG